MTDAVMAFHKKCGFAHQRWRVKGVSIWPQVEDDEHHDHYQLCFMAGFAFCMVSRLPTDYKTKAGGSFQIPSKISSRNCYLKIKNTFHSLHKLVFQMASEDAIRGNLEVEVVRETIVKAADPLPERHIISLSNLDLLSGRFPVTYIYFYRRPSSIHSIKKTLMESLSQCLRHFYPFAGRISENMKSGEPEIICDNSGALVIEAQASIPLKELDFYDLNQSLQGRLVSTNHHFPVQVQITFYICGGISMTFTFDHALGDASAFSKFLVTWSEIAMKKPISCSPDHSRDLPARFPPHYDPSLDESFISWTDVIKECSWSHWANYCDIIREKIPSG